MMKYLEKTEVDSRLKIPQQRLVVGVSGASVDLIKSLSNYYSIPLDIDIHERVFNRNPLSQWDFESLVELFRDAIDEIEVSLVVHSAGAIINYTPIDVIALTLLHTTNFQQLNDSHNQTVQSITEKAINLCNRFTHFVQVFPTGEDKTVSTELLANLKAGLYNRHYDRLGCCVISVPEVLSNDQARLDFIVRVLDLLRG